MEATLRMKFIVVFKLHPFKRGFDLFCGLVVCISCLNDNA